MSLFDDIALIIFVCCFIIFISTFFFHLRKRERPSKYSVFKLIYDNWVKSRLDEESPLTGVQALRNFLMGNSTFISSLFILIGILTGFFENISQNGEQLFNIPGLSLGIIKFSLTIIMLIFCLFNFILSIRYATRLSILITGKPRDFSIGDVKGFKLTKQTLVKAQNHWMLGIRTLFYLATSFFWYINSILFIIVSIIITAYLFISHDVI
ncbi:MAG: DUF599 family protein [Candidatus Lokiarchaeota archaeon]|nr:DUF599 family protein [Candidatus Lokiarchaeota archaeon]